MSIGASLAPIWTLSANVCVYWGFTGSHLDTISHCVCLLGLHWLPSGHSQPLCVSIEASLAPIWTLSATVRVYWGFTGSHLDTLSHCVCLLRLHWLPSGHSTTVCVYWGFTGSHLDTLSHYVCLLRLHWLPSGHSQPLCVSIDASLAPIWTLSATMCVYWGFTGSHLDTLSHCVCLLGLHWLPSGHSQPLCVSIGASLAPIWTLSATMCVYWGFTGSHLDTLSHYVCLLRLHWLPSGHSQPMCVSTGASLAPIWTLSATVCVYWGFTGSHLDTISHCVCLLGLHWLPSGHYQPLCVSIGASLAPIWTLSATVCVYWGFTGSHLDTLSHCVCLLGLHWLPSGHYQPPCVSIGASLAPIWTLSATVCVYWGFTGSHLDTLSHCVCLLGLHWLPSGHSQPLCVSIEASLAPIWTLNHCVCLLGLHWLPSGHSQPLCVSIGASLAPIWTLSAMCVSTGASLAPIWTLSATVCVYWGFTGSHLDTLSHCVCLLGLHWLPSGHYQPLCVSIGASLAPIWTLSATVCVYWGFTGSHLDTLSHVCVYWGFTGSHLDTLSHSVCLLGLHWLPSGHSQPLCVSIGASLAPIWTLSATVCVYWGFTGSHLDTLSHYVCLLGLHWLPSGHSQPLCVSIGASLAPIWTLSATVCVYWGFTGSHLDTLSHCVCLLGLHWLPSGHSQPLCVSIGASLAPIWTLSATVCVYWGFTGSHLDTLSHYVCLLGLHWLPSGHSQPLCVSIGASLAPIWTLSATVCVYWGFTGSHLDTQPLCVSIEASLASIWTLSATVCVYWDFTGSHLDTLSHCVCLLMLHWLPSGHSQPLCVSIGVSLAPIWTLSATVCVYWGLTGSHLDTLSHCVCLLGLHWLPSGHSQPLCVSIGASLAPIWTLSHCVCLLGLHWLPSGHSQPLCVSIGASLAPIWTLSATVCVYWGFTGFHLDTLSHRVCLLGLHWLPSGHSQPPCVSIGTSLAPIWTLSHRVCLLGLHWLPSGHSQPLCVSTGASLAPIWTLSATVCVYWGFTGSHLDTLS